MVMLKKTDRRSLWKFFYSFVKGEQRIIVVSLAANLICTAMEVILPLLQKEAVDRFIATGSLTGIRFFALKYLLCILIHATMVVIFIQGAINVEMTLEGRMRSKAMQHIQKLPVSYYNEVASGDVLARTGTDIDRISDLMVWDIIMLSWSIPATLGSIGVMFYLNGRLAFIACLCMPVLFLIMKRFNGRIFEAGRKARKQNGRVVTHIHEGIKGYRATHVLSAEKSQEEKFDASARKRSRLNVEEIRLRTLYISLTVFVGSLMAVAVLVKGSSDLEKGLIEAGTLSAFLAYVLQILAPVQASAQGYAELVGLGGTMERVKNFLEEKEEDMSGIDGKKADFLGDILFEDVSFAYNGKDRVLEAFSLNIEAGKTTAFVGETGAGKTTIIQLLMRYFSPQSGRILIGGKDEALFTKESVRSQIGCILQETAIFSGTVYDNIAAGKADATDREIRVAADKALISNLDRKASELSAGEKQMVGFARLFLRNPSIVILDEATSNVDTETEKKLGMAADRLLKGRTGLVIAHRLSTVREADKIVVLGEGRILEMGSHRELFDKAGAYRALIDNENGVVM